MGRLPDEFALIARYFAPLASGVPGAAGLRDDAATFVTPPGFETVVTTDALVEGVHFLAEDPPGLVARKALRVNLSDLAAKGAKPTIYLLALSLGPRVDEAWIASFAAGLEADQSEFGIGLAGGDTTSTPGPTTIAVTAMGALPRASVLRRENAKAGDTVFVTGTIGDGALGLSVLKGELGWLGAAERDALVARYRLPQPRTAVGPYLLGRASAALDVSDGLVADLGHIARASGLAATIEAERVPLSPAASAVLAREPGRLASVLTGGDDYEILFTMPSRYFDAVSTSVAKSGVPITAIGRMAEGTGVIVLGKDGAAMSLDQGGYRHF
jgi:thiamine-monophosphate kinase